jgi:lipopolysaccharide transport system ATP-binding protein
MSSVIAVENLSKKYIIGHQKQERYTALRDVLTEGAKHFTRKLIHPFAAQENDPTHEEFWALKDVSFDIKQGERVGIIGRNGAGKSTLLKILSRITEPTSGKVSIKGRVASLLEVGTGFHPELSGRENIYLNGAILGMSKAEIKKKFDEIVAFAEVEKFLDTPVKRYSSGMYVRLAFAVAAHLEPEILIVDEVLAVGDAQFQKKCLGKMEDVGKEGRTVLFVSHNMGAISSLCQRCLLLDRGRVAIDSSSNNAIQMYLEGIKDQMSLLERKDRAGSGHVKFSKIGFRLSSSNTYVQTLIPGEDVTIEVFFLTSENCPRIETANVGLAIFGSSGQLVTILNNQMSGNDIKISGRLNKIVCDVPRFPLMPGRYSVTATLQIGGDLFDQVQSAANFTVESGDYYQSGFTNSSARNGVYIMQHWKLGAENNG